MNEAEPHVVPINFSGRHVFVAGGTSGINLGIAEAFARADARISVISRNQQRVDRAVARLRELTDSCEGASADVR